MLKENKLLYVYHILILVKVRKLLDMGFLIKMILSASARFFKSENPTVKDLVEGVNLAAPPKFNHKRIMLIIHLGFIHLVYFLTS